MNARFHPSARADIAGARAWYEGKQRGLGRRFVGAVDAALRRIREVPLAAPPWPRAPKELDVRRLRLLGFPYAVAYLVRGDTCVILAVAHQRQRPDYWLGRARD